MSSAKQPYSKPLHGRSAAGTSRHRGMTLIEVVIAMFVLVTVFAAALTAIIQAKSLAVSAKNRIRATAILNMRMEEMRAMPFATLKTKLGTSTFLNGTENSAELTDTATSYSYSWTREEISATATSEGTDLLCVVITVQWTERGRAKSLKTLSYFSATGVSTKQAAA